jgi:hypothetical protein
VSSKNKKASAREAFFGSMTGVVNSKGHLSRRSGVGNKGGDRSCA